ncbi:tyrosine-type recombinase/integrase [Xanthobacter autotrophicus]|uniref:tyrosine-type recombinase/integrase n=1 Tax=Xanthobacter autotrophicus TaxID=280 RepID=UPI00372CA8C6
MSARLTKRIVDAAAPSKAQVFIWDSEVKGFGLRVTPSGGKAYILQYRTAEGQTRRLTIGKHGSPWTTDDAREKAKEALRSLALHGVDPLAAKEAARSAASVADLADLYLKEGPSERPNKKQRSWDTDAAILRAHVKPLLGTRPVKSLTRADIAKFQSDVAEGKSARTTKTKPRGAARVTGGKGIAARATATLRAMLSFAAGRGIIPANPASGVRLFKQEKVERFLSEAEVAKLAETIAGMEDGMKLHASFAACIRLLMLTGCRRGEIEGLQWDWIDFGRGMIRFPDSKTGAKVTPLPAPAVDILKGLERKKDNPYVFPATRGAEGHVVGLSKAWGDVRTAADMPELRLHDLRHSFASFAVAGGAALYLVGKVLGHKQARTTEIYAHLRDDPLKKVADSTARKIAGAMKKGEARGANGPAPEKARITKKTDRSAK